MRKGIRTFWEHGVMPTEKQNKITKLETEIKSHPRKQKQTQNKDKGCLICRCWRVCSSKEKTLQIKGETGQYSTGPSSPPPDHYLSTLMRKSSSSSLEISASTLFTPSIQFLSTTHFSLNSLEPYSYSSSHLAPAAIMDNFRDLV